MPNSVDYFLQGIQTGANLRSDQLRLQELRSQATFRRLQEQRAAKELEFLIQQNDQRVQRQADMQKANARFELFNAPVVPVPSAVGAIMVPNPMKAPTTGHAFMQAFGPTAQTPEEAARIAQTGTMLTMKPMADQALIAQREAQTKLSEARIEDLRTKDQSLLTEEERAARAKQQGLVPSGLDEKGRTSFSRPNTKQVIRALPGGGFEVISGATDSDISSADRSNLKQRTIKLEDTARRIQPLVDQADKLFGPKALAGTVVVDRFLANFNPNLVEGQRVQGRQAARYAFEGLIRSLTEGQGALSNRDVERIQGLFPDLGKVDELLENPARARQLLKSLQKQLSRDAATDARMLGESPTPDVLRHADPAFLLEEFRAKRITSEQFREAINKNVHAEDAKALLDRL